jgi:Peptidase family M48
MKRSVAFVVFFLVFGFALAGLYWSQRRAKSTPVSPNAILNMAADAQRDLSRLPMHLTRLSDEQEVAIGREFASRYASETRPLTAEEQGLEKYVRRVGANIALHARRHLPYTFTVLRDHNMLNAFSLPGGPVYISEGMLDLMTNEDELASVLAHEVSAHRPLSFGQVRAGPSANEKAQCLPVRHPESKRIFPLASLAIRALRCRQIASSRKNTGKPAQPKNRFTSNGKCTTASS